MSRNLGITHCHQCGGDVALEEEPRPITRDDAGPYFDEYHRKRLIVANASCPDCRAKYLAWVSSSIGGHLSPSDVDWMPGRFVDLSYRHAFNDEPDREDIAEISTLAARALRLLREPERDESYLEKAIGFRPSGPLLTSDACIEVAEAWMQRADDLRKAGR